MHKFSYVSLIKNNQSNIDVYGNYNKISIKFITINFMTTNISMKQRI